MPSPTPTRKTLSDLKASILNPALTSHFECTFNPPQLVKEWINDKSGAGLGVSYDGNEQFFSLSCSEASLPGSSLATHEINNDYTGVTERHVYRRQYDDRVSFTFYVDHDYYIIYFFENWISFIVNEQFAEQNGIPGIEQLNHFYRVNFPKQYQTESLYIKKFERDYAGRALQYKFMNAYPISIDSMPVSYDSSQLLKCTVSFNYSRYIVGGGEDIKSTTPQSPSSPTPGTPESSFDSSKLPKIITNEYYNNGIEGRNFNQRQAPGQRSLDVTNFTRGIA